MHTEGDAPTAPFGELELLDARVKEVFRRWNSGAVNGDETIARSEAGGGCNSTDRQDAEPAERLDDITSPQLAERHQLQPPVASSRQACFEEDAFIVEALVWCAAQGAVGGSVSLHME